jgi:two-component system, sensor histidine kinase and response regulator
MNGFFIQPEGASLFVYGIYSPWLVVLSFAMAVFTSTMALQVAGVAALIRGRWQRQLAIGSGAIALGGGTWAMHFVGMLAFDLCTPVQYDMSQTLLSMLPSLVASWVALELLARSHISNRQLVMGGALVGAGIGAMHYSGMAAMHMAPTLRYDPLWFALSILVAMGLAMLALWIRFGLHGLLGRRRLGAWQTLVLSGCVMGLAVACMHYIGMVAARFIALPGFAADGPSSQANWVALQIALATVMVSVLIAVAATAVLRYRQLFGQMRASESRLQAIVDTAANGLIMLDGTGAIKTFNPAAERMFGWAASEVVGKNASVLLQHAFGTLFNQYLDKHRRTGDAGLLGQELDFDGLHKEGYPLPFRVIIGQALLGNEAVFVGFITDTRERMAMEQALRDSEQQYRSLLSHTPGMAFRRRLTPGWPLVFMSEGALAVTGWTAQQFMEQQVEFHSLVHPEDLQWVEPIMQRAMDQQTPFGTEFRILHRDGLTRWVMSRGGVVHDETGAPRFLDGLIMDIADRMLAEQALLRQEQQFRSLIRNIPGISLRFLMSEQRPLVFISEAVEAMTGWPADAFLKDGKSYDDLIHPQDLPRFVSEVLQVVQERRSYSVEYRLRHRAGHFFWVWGRGAATYDEQGAPLWIDGIVLDIHERREMQDALVAAKDKAELAAASKTAFLANMSHEIRTPMNAIIGFTEFLLGSGLTHMQRRHLTTVRQSARSLLGLLNSILDTAKLEKGAVELEAADFSLEELVTQVVDAQRLTAEGKGLLLQLQYHPALGKFFKGDALRVQQVLSNLLGNAIKFTARGFVRLQVFDDAGQVHIAVYDSGIGIAADRLDKIFAPFSQADASMSRRFGGTGLGTTIARQLVELMQGTLWVNSKLGVGSDFHVRLPLPACNAVAAPPESMLQQLPALRILAVDDVLQNLELMGLVLGHAGHQVVMVSDGAQAVAAWQARASREPQEEGGPFDVVLMDVQMPGMDGLEATRRIRQQEQARGLRATPIIALTASVLEQNRAATHDAGMDGIASKPIELADLMAEIARLTGHTLPARASAAPQPQRAASARMPVDWSRGAALWGSTATQERAIRQMLTEHLDAGFRLSQQLHSGDSEAARQLVHSLRGAAGNLCLVTLQALTTDMEDPIRAQALHTAVEALPRLDACIAEIWSELGTRIEPSDEARPPPPPDQDDWSAERLRSAQFQDLTAALVESLRHGELNDAGLLQLTQALRGAGQSARAQALENALKAFEFQRAEELIIELLEALAEPTHRGLP